MRRREWRVEWKSSETSGAAAASFRIGSAIMQTLRRRAAARFPLPHAATATILSPDIRLTQTTASSAQENTPSAHWSSPPFCRHDVAAALQVHGPVPVQPHQPRPPHRDGQCGSAIMAQRRMTQRRVCSEGGIAPLYLQSRHRRSQPGSLALADPCSALTPAVLRLDVLARSFHNHLLIVTVQYDLLSAVPSAVAGAVRDGRNARRPHGWIPSAAHINTPAAKRDNRGSGADRLGRHCDCAWGHGRARAAAGTHARPLLLLLA